ncbi:unnamed protein product [Prorocentrum cordatum]|uniref:Uncharacterized protein n=1 Tax=Prorocentrum cordatum TaxID=2364126 RepID=A0ABN9PNA5_9DINO|nr:unnamed protein product [Polarella glacialis]
MLHNAAGNNKNDEAAKLRPLEILTVYMSLGATVLSIILWIAIVSIGDEWIKKRNLFYSIDTDLLHVYVGHGFVGKAFQKAAEHLSGHEIAILQAFPHKKFYLEEFREFICTLPKIPGYTVNLCLMWTGVQYGSWMMLFGVVLGTIFMAIAGVLLYWYAFIKARKITRVFYKLFYILAPLVQITATAGYVSATILVEDMLPAGQGVSVGSSVMFSFGACLLSAVPCVIVSFMLGTLHVEKVNEFRSDQKKFAKENPELYGSTDTPTPVASVQGAEFGQQQGPWQTQGQWQPQGPWHPQGWQPQGQMQPQQA